ncbi:HAD-like domain-containing protein [Fusarium redolens]|uniref:HAD-like domain-containing protein n=1 Tax=Fusarium redolens TaxID=48865 RepID=A0A9P9GFB3_FUSRE|nr:HAD-like domain-containing protein [Fusarium redolens]KAH7237773.1 HAD-like domain-containing protein [Fusarium redolens]
MSFQLVRQVMESHPMPPSEPPDKLEPQPSEEKVIFFTFNNTLFDFDRATRSGLQKCRQMNPDLGKKTIQDITKSYHQAMKKAFELHLRWAVLSLPPPLGRQASFYRSNPVPGPRTGKVTLMFQELGLKEPPVSECRRIGQAFADEFKNNRFEIEGASRCLTELRQLQYKIAIIDDIVDMDLVRHLNLLQYIDDIIISPDQSHRKPDQRIFKKGLDTYRVPAAKAVMVGSSVDDDIVGIINVGAEPILYRPSSNLAFAEIQMTNVMVVRSMDELVSMIKTRPENQALVRFQQQQQRAVFLAFPSIGYSNQDQGSPDDLNSGPSSQAPDGGPYQPLHPSLETQPRPSDDGLGNQALYEALPPPPPPPLLPVSNYSYGPSQNGGLPSSRRGEPSTVCSGRDVVRAYASSGVPSYRHREETVNQGTAVYTNPHMLPYPSQGCQQLAGQGENIGPANESFPGASTQQHPSEPMMQSTEVGKENGHKRPTFLPLNDLPPKQLKRDSQTSSRHGSSQYPLDDAFGVANRFDTEYQDSQRFERCYADNGEVSRIWCPTRDEDRVRTASQYRSWHEHQVGLSGQQNGESTDVFAGPLRDVFSKRSESGKFQEVGRFLEDRRAGPSSENGSEPSDEQRHGDSASGSEHSDRRATEVTDLTSDAEDQEPPNLAGLYRPSIQVYDTTSNGSQLEPRGKSQAEAPERGTRFSDQQPSSSAHGSAVASGGRLRGMPLSDMLNHANVRPFQASGSQSLSQDDGPAGSSGQHQRTAPHHPDIRIFAQQANDLLEQETTRLDSSSEDVREHTEATPRPEHQDR